MGTDTSGHNSIAIIGAGHMGSALVEGFIKAGIPPRQIITSNKSPQKLSTLRSRFKIRTALSNKKAAASARFIFLTVKPAMVPEVLHELAGILAGNVIISAAAGVPIQSLKQHISDGEVVMELMETTGKSILSDVNMHTIIYKLFTGTLTYMQHHQISATDLKLKVATKGGITEQILHSLDLGGMPKIFQNSIDEEKNTISNHTTQKSTIKYAASANRILQI